MQAVRSNTRLGLTSSGEERALPRDRNRQRVRTFSMCSATACASLLILGRRLRSSLCPYAPLTSRSGVCCAYKIFALFQSGRAASNRAIHRPALENSRVRQVDRCEEAVWIPARHH